MVINLPLWCIILVSQYLFKTFLHTTIFLILLHNLWLTNNLLLNCFFAALLISYSLLTMLRCWIAWNICFTNAILDILVLHSLFILFGNMLITYSRNIWIYLFVKLFCNFISHARMFHSWHNIWRCFLWLRYSDSLRHCTLLLNIFNRKIVNIMVGLNSARYN